MARFDGGPITSDAGGLLLREVEEHTGIIRQMARCFTDYRDEDLIEHSVEQLLRQRIFGLAVGYEACHIRALRIIALYLHWTDCRLLKPDFSLHKFAGFRYRPILQPDGKVKVIDTRKN